MEILLISLMLMFGGNYDAKTVDTYKIQLGKKCNKQGNISSYVWLHTVYGPQQVKKEYCKNGKR